MIWVGSCVLWRQAKTEVEQSLEAVTTERDELREELAARAMIWVGQLRAVEQAKTEVEQSLEAVTTERDELREELAARAMIWVGSCVLWSRRRRRWSRAWRPVRRSARAAGGAWHER
ncbi:hypothetical protein TcBrA4_0135880 [Trypanosoma cruzi]|nr:hypothetical protein TcBrA4_0135880 [Trypanosoma cruzi]